MIIYGPEVVRWVEQRIHRHGHFDTPVGIGLQRPNYRIVAGVVLSDYNGANMNFHIAAEGLWAKPDFLRAVFEYAFHQARVKRLTGIIASSNIKAIRFAEALGATFETRLKDAHPKGDLVIYRMRADECRWLGECHERLAA